MKDGALEKIQQAAGIKVAVRKALLTHASNIGHGDVNVGKLDKIVAKVCRKIEEIFNRNNTMEYTLTESDLLGAIVKNGVLRLNRGDLSMNAVNDLSKAMELEKNTAGDSNTAGRTKLSNKIDFSSAEASPNDLSIIYRILSKSNQQQKLESNPGYAKSIYDLIKTELKGVTSPILSEEQINGAIISSNKREQVDGVVGPVVRLLQGKLHPKAVRALKEAAAGPPEGEESWYPEPDPEDNDPIYGIPQPLFSLTEDRIGPIKDRQSNAKDLYAAPADPESATAIVEKGLAESGNKVPDKGGGDENIKPGVNSRP